MGGGRVPRLLFLSAKPRAVHQSRERRREEQKEERGRERKPISRRGTGRGHRGKEKEEGGEEFKNPAR